MRKEVRLEKKDEDRYKVNCPFCQKRVVIEREVIRRTSILRNPYEVIEEVEWRASNCCRHLIDIDPLRRKVIFES